MTSQEYDLWAKHHAALFQLHSAADAPMFAAWRPILLAYDYAACIAASTWIACEKSSEFRTRHLDLIRHRINTQRVAFMQSQIEEAQRKAEMDTCQICFSVAVVIVPHPDFVTDGIWIPPYPTTAIFCQCSRGQLRFEEAYRSRQESKKKLGMPLRWDRYEGIIPHWRQLLESREKLRNFEQHARHAAHFADRASPLRQAVKQVLHDAEKLLEQKGELQ